MAQVPPDLFSLLTVEEIIEASFASTLLAAGFPMEIAEPLAVANTQLFRPILQQMIDAGIFAPGAKVFEDRK